MTNNPENEQGRWDEETPHGTQDEEKRRKPFVPPRLKREAALTDATRDVIDWSICS